MIRCPECCTGAVKLIGLGLKAQAIDAVMPQEKKFIAEKVLRCPNKSCFKYNWTEENMYCPQCETWSLKLESLANEGSYFNCSACEINFSIIN